MSKITEFKPKFSAGHQRYLINGSDTIQDYLKCDGGVALQSAYPTLFNEIGHLQDPDYGNVWGLSSTGTTTTKYCMTYGNGKYLCAGDNGTMRSSTNGINWSSASSGTTTIIRAMTYGNGVYVHGGGAGSNYVYASTNGVNWQASSQFGGNTYALGYNGSVILRGGEVGALSSSGDGINYTARTSGTSSYIFDIAYGNGKNVYVGSRCYGHSTNHINWVAVGSGSTINSIAFGNGIFVYGGNGGVISTSTNGANWSAQTSGTTSSIKTVCFANGIFVYGGDGGVLRTSTNGINWVARTSGTTYTIYAIEYGINEVNFVGYGTNGGYSILYNHNYSTEFSLPTSNDILQYPSPNQPSAYIKAI